MPITRREFVRGGVTAFTVSFAAPEFLSDLALAQGRSSRNLVVLYLSGGNDALSTLIPYNDAQYRARRPTIAIPASQVLQIGTDRTAKVIDSWLGADSSSILGGNSRAGAPTIL